MTGDDKDGTESIQTPTERSLSGSVYPETGHPRSAGNASTKDSNQVGPEPAGDTSINQAASQHQSSPSPLKTKLPSRGEVKRAPQPIPEGELDDDPKKPGTFNLLGHDLNPKQPVHLFVLVLLWLPLKLVGAVLSVPGRTLRLIDERAKDLNESGIPGATFFFAALVVALDWFAYSQLGNTLILSALKVAVPIALFVGLALVYVERETKNLVPSVWSIFVYVFLLPLLVMAAAPFSYSGHHSGKDWFATGWRFTPEPQFEKVMEKDEQDHEVKKEVLSKAVWSTGPRGWAIWPTGLWRIQGVSYRLPISIERTAMTEDKDILAGRLEAIVYLTAGPGEKVRLVLNYPNERFDSVDHYHQTKLNEIFDDEFLEIIKARTLSDLTKEFREFDRGEIVVEEDLEDVTQKLAKLGFEWDERLYIKEVHTALESNHSLWSHLVSWFSK